MRRFAVVGVAVSIGVLVFAPSGLAASARVAALQVGLRAHGFDPGPVDGVRGPLTTTRARRVSARTGIRADGLVGRANAGGRSGRAAGRCSASASSGSARRLGRRGARVPAAALRARRARSRRAVHAAHRRRASPLSDAARPRSGRDRRAEDVPLARGAQSARRRPATWHVVAAGRELLLDRGALPREPVAARAPEPALAHERDRPGPAPGAPEGRAADAPAASPARRRAATPSARRSTTGRGSTASTRRSRARSRGWSRASSRTSSRASARSASCSCCPETWEFVDLVLLGERTPRNYQGNVRAGVRYLRWQLDEFGGDRRLALAGWYQGARAVRERGPLRRHEGVRPHRARALRHRLSPSSVEACVCVGSARSADALADRARSRPARRPSPGARPVEQPDLHEERRLVPVDVLVRDLAVRRTPRRRRTRAARASPSARLPAAAGPSRCRA